MKNLVVLLAAAMTMSCSDTQKIPGKDVPSAVKNALEAKYPKADDVDWSKEQGNYEAGFEIGETEYSLLIDASGNILETEIEINKDTLPAAVKDYVSKNYSGKKIKEAAKITDANGIVTYEAEVKDKALMFDSNGNFIKETND